MTALETAGAVAALPENKALQNAWQEELKKILEADSMLADELRNLLELDQGAQAIGDTIGITSLGDNNKVIGKVEVQGNFTM